MAIPMPSDRNAIGLTEIHDLRSGQVAWKMLPDFERQSHSLPTEADVVIVGSGVMAATVGQRLAASGRQVTFVDRHAPATASTAASTAQVMWGMDMPLTELASKIGESGAAARWLQVYRSVRGFSDHIERLEIDCAKADIPTVYLDGNKLDANGLAAEAAMHAAHGLPTTFQPAEQIADRFGVAARPANISLGGFEVDPVRLTLGLLDEACANGATVCWPHDVVALSQLANDVEISLSDGEVFTAKEVILCTGYERPLLYLPPAFSLLSTFVIATPPETSAALDRKAMYWEAADPYLYVRATSDGRIIAGGEDIESADTATRDRLLPEKAGVIKAKLERLLGCGPLPVDCHWSATFGTSPDTLPAIGRAANSNNIWLSYGFGGNGIAFAAVAAELLVEALTGGTPEALQSFDPYRFQ